MKFLVFCFFAFMLCSCNTKNSVDNAATNDIVAEVNGSPIRACELDELVSQQMFDEFSRIYKFRNVALDYLIDSKLIEQEANKKNLTSKEFLNEYYDSMIDPNNIDSLISVYGISSLQTIKGTSMAYLDNSNHEGRIAQRNALEAILKTQLLDSLKRNNTEISKYIYPPKSASLNLSGLPIYYRGNPNSKVTMVIASDFECEKCIQAHDRYNEIYEQYKDKVKFGYINFSSSPTFASLASEAASKQNKYWEFSDSLFAKKGSLDSLSIYNIAKNLNLDIERFDTDLHSKENLDTQNDANDDLIKRGLFATPTIIINGRLIFDSGSTKEITYLLDKELKE